MTTTPTLRADLMAVFHDLTLAQVSVLAGMLAQHLLTTDADVFARMLDEARAIS